MSTIGRPAAANVLTTRGDCNRSNKCAQREQHSGFSQTFRIRPTSRALTPINHSRTLVDLKVEPYLIAATLEGVLAQRLVRKICPECRERYTPDPGAVALLAHQPVGQLKLERGRGCAACRQTGYRGRAGIFELLVVTEEIKRELLATPNAGALRELAEAQGMVTLRRDGWRKVQAGITTVEEVLRVTDR